MNSKFLNQFMRPKSRPTQYRPEWLMCLEICKAYLKKHEIKNPIVIELGTGRNRQKRFWEQIFGAHHIGIDYSDRRGNPDILGNTHELKTLEMLKKELKGRPINILFIDAAHRYKDVKKDFEMYSPLCTDIIMLHDIETNRYYKNARVEVFKFWDELMEKAYRGKGEYKDFLFLSIYQHYEEFVPQMGVGMIIKK